MTDPIRIAHISDLHLNVRFDRETIRRTRHVFASIKQLSVDHTVITGDITANGDPMEMDAFRSLAASHGLLDTARLSVVIGNHDIFGGAHLAEDVLAFPAKCRKAAYTDKVANFVGKVPELFSRCVFARNRRPFPYVKPVGPIVLVGINSVARYSRMKNPIGSNGEVDDQQFEDLERLFATKTLKKYPKVVLIHHHFSTYEETSAGAIHSLWSRIEQQTMKLRGKKRLMKLFAENDVRCVLHGHVHRVGMYVRKGLKFVNGGGAVLGSDRAVLAVNVLTVGTDTAEVETHTFPVPTALPPRHRQQAFEIQAPVAPPLPQFHLHPPSEKLSVIRLPHAMEPEEPSLVSPA